MSYTVVFLCRAWLHDISALGTFFWSEKCFRKNILLFVAKFSSLVWRKVVNSDVGIIIICQSYMVFLIEPPLSYIPQFSSRALGILMLQHVASEDVWMKLLHWFLSFNCYFSLSYHSHLYTLYRRHAVLADISAQSKPLSSTAEKGNTYALIPAEWNHLLLTVHLKSPFYYLF